jgi:hypothetical protein
MVSYNQIRYEDNMEFNCNLPWIPC